MPHGRTSWLGLALVLGGCGAPGGWAAPGVGDYVVAWSPDGARLACSPRSTNPEQDERVRVVLPDGDLAPVAFTPAAPRVHALRFSGPDALQALTSDGLRVTLERFDPTSGAALGAPVRLPAPEGTFLREAASSDGVRWVLVWEHALTCVDVSGDEARLVWERPRGEDEFPSALTVSPDGQRAAVAISRLTSDDGPGVVVHAPWIELLGLERGDTALMLGPLVSHAPVASGPGPHPVLCLDTLAFSGDGALLASGEEGGWVRLWDLAAGAEAGGVRVGRGAAVTDLAFAGSVLGVGSSDKSVTVLALSQGASFGPPGAPARLTATELWRDDPPGGADGFRTRVAFSPDGRKIARAVAMYSPWEEEDGERQLRVFAAGSGRSLD